jgi:hypothetical protein
VVGALVYMCIRLAREREVVLFEGVTEAYQAQST